MDIASSTLSALRAEHDPAAAGGERDPSRHRPAPRSRASFASSTRQVFDELWMEIRDNGLGLTCFGGVVPPEGVGLRNTRARLQQLYSHDHRLTLEDAPGGGCIVQNPYSLPHLFRGGQHQPCPFECCLATMKL